MKTERTNRKRNTRLLLLLGLLLAGIILLIGASIAAFLALRQSYRDRCVIRTLDASVEIVAGKIVPAEVIANHFGLTNGANLACIDFAKRRERLIADMPNIRDAKIVRRPPDHVRIETFEREPVARLFTGSDNRNSNRVADREGVVFWYPRRDTILLPVVREKAPKTSFGGRLAGLTAAALRLADAAGAHPKLKIQEADASGAADYVLAVLGNSSRAKVAWEDMSGDGKAAQASLHRQLSRLEKAVTSDLARGTRLWNATDYGTPGRIYASEPTKTE